MTTETTEQVQPKITEHVDVLAPKVVIDGAGAQQTPATTKPGTDQAGAKTDQDPKTIEIGDDVYEIDDKNFIKISARAFKQRISRYTKTELKSAFGTDDVEEIKSRLDEHGKLKAKSEDERRKQLANEEKLAEDLKKEKDLRVKAEARASQLSEDREYREADQEVRDIAARHMTPKGARYAAIDLGEHIRGLDEKEAAKFGSKDVTAFFKQWAEENPEFAKKQDGGKSTEERKPLTHGAGERREAPAPAQQGVGGKTPKPGQPNSMDEKEVRQMLKDRFNIRD